VVELKDSHTLVDRRKFDSLDVEENNPVFKTQFLDINIAMEQLRHDAYRLLAITPAFQFGSLCSGRGHQIAWK